MNGMVQRIPMTESSLVAEARRIALASATRAGFPETDLGRVALVVTELGTNLVKHGTEGEMLIGDPAENGCRGLEIISLDKGPGMANVSECMRDGYSTTGSHGSGLGAISRLSDEMDIYSMPGKGTAIYVRLLLKKVCPNPLPFTIAGFSVAVKGEPVCGDAWAFQGTSEEAIVLAVDGLGHGFPAAQAAAGAIAAFDRSPNMAPAELLNSIHLNIRSTRGAAAAAAYIDFSRQVVHYSGVGNLSGVIVSEGPARHMVSMNGTLGHEIRGMRTFEYAWSRGAMLVLHSDGVSSRWDLKDYPGLAQKSAAVIAGVLYRDLKRERDDATVVVLKQENSV